MAADLTRMASFLATDKVPETIFGIPITASREQYTEADIQFFEEHPDAGGYYDMGDDPSANQGDLKGGDPAVYSRTTELTRSVDQNPGAYDGEISDNYVKKPDGWYVKNTVSQSWLDDPEEGSGAWNAYQSIQSEYQKRNGREMDHETALIRARLAAGDIDRGKALEIARYVRERRDRRLASDTMFEYAKDNGLDPHKLSVKDFYVPTQKVSKVIGAEGFRKRLQDNVLNNEASRTTDMKKAFLAKRFGFTPEVADVEIEVNNPAADNPANFPKDSMLSGLSLGPISIEPGRRAAAAARARINTERRRAAELNARGRLDEENRDLLKRNTDRELNRLGLTTKERRDKIYAPEMYTKDVPRKLRKTVKQRTGMYVDTQADVKGGETSADVREGYPGSWNNPGNIMPGAVVYNGENGTAVGKKSGHTFLTFATPQAGLDAMGSSIGQMVREKLPQYFAEGKIPSKDFTVHNLINVYAPPSDNNDTTGYINEISKELGVDKHAVLNMQDPTTMVKLLRSMARRESGADHANWFNDNEYKSAVRHMSVPVTKKRKR